MGTVSTAAAFAMGGDAFPNTKRLSESEYARICEVIRSTLETAGVRFGFPVEVKDKAEVCKQRGKVDPYGDVDVIIAHDDKNARLSLLELVKNTIGTEDGKVLKNDTTYSFLTQERYQVDLLFCKEESFNFLLAFKSNNDFGALLGHLLTPLDLKWSCAGLLLKLKNEKVSGIGTFKDELMLSKDVLEVCDFLGLPAYSLDAATRLSTQEIFEILTRTKVFFANDYDEKYKIRERRKKRPVSDSFFNFLENTTNDLESFKNSLYANDELVKIFSAFRESRMASSEYLRKISEYFGKEEELVDKLNKLNEESKKFKGNTKFNYYVLSSWFPELDPNTVGKIIGKMKSRHSGTGSEEFDNWINKTELDEIRKEAIKCT